MRSSKRFFSSFMRPGNYSSSSNNSRYHLRGLKYTLALSGACYLYMQEEILSKIITEVQAKFYNYRTLVLENKEKFEINEQRKRLYDLFEPESRIAHLSEKISRQLNALEPFDGDFLALFVDDKVQELKDNGAQVFLAQKGGGKTMEALRIAKKWKEAEGPVLFFDGTDYVKFEGNESIFSKYGVTEVGQLKKVLKEASTEVVMKFDLLEPIKRLNRVIPALLLAHPSSETNEKPMKQQQQPAIEEKKKQLLIVIDDADDLRPLRGNSKQGIEGDNAKTEFLLQVRELEKEGFAKVLFLCRDAETKNWLKEDFESGVWKGISKGSAELKSKAVVEKYLNYVSELTGTRMPEAEKFFYFFGVDFLGLVELRKYIQKYKEAHRDSPVNIDGFIEKKVREAEGSLRQNDLEKAVMKVCKKIDGDWKSEKLSVEDKEKLEGVLESNLKYKAAAYSTCGKPWKSLLKDQKSM